MNREEAIEELYMIIENQYRSAEKDKEALNMAINALEQEPYGGCVSRQEIQQKINRLWNSNGDKDYCMETLKDFVTELQSVTPAQKWIPVSERLPNGFDYVFCTCHSLIDNRADWVVETVYNPHFKNGPYSVWGNIPMLNWGECEVVAWMHREFPEPYEADRKESENDSN